MLTSRSDINTHPPPSTSVNLYHAALRWWCCRATNANTRKCPVGIVVSCPVKPNQISLSCSWCKDQAFVSHIKGSFCTPLKALFSHGARPNIRLESFPYWVRTSVKTAVMLLDLSVWEYVANLFLFFSNRLIHGSLFEGYVCYTEYSAFSLFSHHLLDVVVSLVPPRHLSPSVLFWKVVAATPVHAPKGLKHECEKEKFPRCKLSAMVSAY